MRRCPFAIALVVSFVLWCAPLSAMEPAETMTPERLDFFEKKIRPVLVENCYRCHSAKAEKVGGELLLDTRDGIRRGGESGHAVVPSDPGASLLLAAIRYETNEMPPDRKLPDAVIADFETWVRMGAPDPRTDSSQSVAKTTVDVENGKKFWAFQPPRMHPAPAIRRAEWPRQPIDAFVLSRIEEASLQPNPEADPRTLIRRATYDLTGLPPTVEEVEEFVRSYSRAGENAYEAIIDRLLASPRYGERWARMWLDLARYAEDQAHIVGNNDALFTPNAYLYRDWVIKALNDDLPYDRFIEQQLAADLIDSNNEANLPALSFMGLGPKYYRRGDLAVMADEWEDRVDVVTRGLLGLTVACARCHDHKFDPIPTEDYYALAGVFASTEMFNRPLDNEKPKDDKGQAKAPKDALHVIRDIKPQDLSVFVRGDVNSRGAKVERRFLQVLCTDKPARFTEGSGRRELAAAIANRDNPLTARVLVNRVWAHYFGRGLVGTLSNLGQTGERPTHPELLDDLAVRFMEAGWSLKWLHRQIVLSAAYRQSSAAAEDKVALDPDNRWLARMNARRLDVEAWRDTVLAVSGHLDSAVGGKSVEVDDPQATRRTVYARVSRLQLNPMLVLFDFPDPNTHADHRAQTTTALQKLFLLNSPFMVRHAELLADRLLALPSEKSDRERIDYAYRLLYGRPASKDEMQLGETYVRIEGERVARWRQYAQVLLSANELSYVD